MFWNLLIDYQKPHVPKMHLLDLNIYYKTVISSLMGNISPNAHQNKPLQAFKQGGENIHTHNTHTVVPFSILGAKTLLDLLVPELLEEKL